MADKTLADIWVKKTTGNENWTKLALVNKRSFKTFGSLNITDLNHIIGYQLETLHLSFYLRHLSDKYHHGAAVFPLLKIGSARGSN